MRKERARIGHPTFLSLHIFKDPSHTGSRARAFQRDLGDRDLGGYIAFRLLMKAVFGERGRRGWLSGANPWCIGITGRAFDAMTDKRGGNEFD